MVHLREEKDPGQLVQCHLHDLLPLQRILDHGHPFSLQQSLRLPVLVHLSDCDRLSLDQSSRLGRSGSQDRLDFAGLCGFHSLHVDGCLVIIC